ncbi:MAG: hypothetical protein LBG75_01990 [Candidatus Nomurabacteria bacterium]|nr:hypothetical protein [Candidatus Nomurabacteria bacterium]
MVEINLIPDVKRELLKAQKLRNMITVISIMASIAAIGVIVVLAVIVFAVQGVASMLADKSIQDEYSKFESHNGVVEALTLQSQLTGIENLKDKKYLASRIFGVVNELSEAATNPAIGITELRFDKEAGTLTIDGQASQGFTALEAFKKTADRTVIYYRDGDGAGYSRTSKCKYTAADGKGKYSKANLMSSEITTSEVSYGQDASGNKVLRFTITLTLDEHVLAFNSFDSDAIDICAPGAQNVTDSYIQIPKGMFTQKAQDIEEGK